MTDIVALSIPAFVVLIVAELIVDRLRGGGLYTFDAAITDLSCGVGNQVFELFTKAALVAVYVGVYEAGAAWDMPADAVATWIFAFVAVDFLFYWWHRANHRCNILWAVHVVHHQSEEFNLAAALRQELFNKITQLVFYLPLALLGVPPIVFATTAAISTVYMFWVHTRVIPKLGPVEWVMNTPSHHRVHHGRDAHYVDRNYAGVFIVFDRLFGTFAEEQAEPIYGTVKPFHSRNPVWANFEPYVALYELGKTFDSRKDAVRLWFKPPEWRPASAGGDFEIPDARKEGRPKYDTPHGPAVGWWITFNFAVAALATGGLLLFEEHVPRWLVFAGGAWVLWGTVNWGALMERRRWARPAEALRVVVAVGLLLASPTPAWADGGGEIHVTAHGRVTSERYSAFHADRSGADSPDGDEVGARAHLHVGMLRPGPEGELTWEAEVEAELYDGAVSGEPSLAGDDLPGRGARGPGLNGAWLSIRRGRELGLKVGLMGSDWGLGLVADSGEDDPAGPETWFKQARHGDRVIRATVFGMPFNGLLIAVGLDRVWNDDIASDADGDAAHQAVLAIRQYLAADRWFGMYVVRREQEYADGKRLTANVADFAADMTFGPTRLQAELAAIDGETSLGATPEHPIHQLERAAAAFRVTHAIGGGLTADVEGAWLSGDATMDDDTSSAFRADRNFQQGLVLFPRVLATWSARSRLNASDPDVVGVPAEDLDKLATDGALQGVTTLFPKFGWQATPGVSIYAGALMAWATADVLDPFNTRTGGGLPHNHLDRQADSSYLGTEYDLGLRMGTELPWRLGELSVTTELGVLAPSGGLAGLGTVQGGRITLGWSESQGDER